MQKITGLRNMKQKQYYIKQLFCNNKSSLPLEIQFIILKIAGIADCSRKGCYFWVFRPNLKNLTYKVKKHERNK